MSATKIGTLKRGLKIGEVFHTEFELREMTTADMFAAEADAPIDKSFSYSGALLCRQLVRIGDFKGPFTLAVIGKLPPGDFARLRIAQRELDEEGEAEQPG